MRAETFSCDRALQIYLNLTSCAPAATFAADADADATPGCAGDGEPAIAATAADALRKYAV